MAYDPNTGKYTPDDAGVEKRLTGLLSKDSLLMQQATTQGKQAANRRGLLNSTMAVSAAQSSRINAALPIASQEAGQTHQTNLQGFDTESRERMQGKDITSREGMQERDITSREGMQDKDIGNSRYLQGQDITSRERMQGRDITSREGMLGSELSSRERMQGSDIEHEQFMQQQDIETRERISNLDRDAQERIANLNVAADERQAASALAASFESSYAQILSNIMANPDIPADARQRYMDHAARVRDSNLSLVEQLYSVDLNWQSSNSPIPNPNARPGGPPPRRDLIR